MGTVLSRFTGLAFDGATSGITSVLVFGAGANYALLLISRYREELTGAGDHHLALRTAVARAGSAITASNATVVLALLTLVLAAAPATRSLGLHAACGLLVALVFVLLVLPPLLGLFGRRLFWPFIPRRGDQTAVTTGVWHGIAAWSPVTPVVLPSRPWRFWRCWPSASLAHRSGCRRSTNFG